eukprot:CAMPEP_0202497248 /NCGR_PEP_ID=MMETSP1361-20130828/22393_1 /ASSEMBLY_ACC=CAM_ASM_000849 /TAXON_ID=210615 /ORGANISM="Staurosira complex sp., Strain CCMP2646" /LENGTH=112 /DNA_ID=CAMNT_0049128805 /DNA_START=291 /DNA_END=629 /DNA_ORIENTATION=-
MAEEESVCNGAEGTKGVNNKGDQESIAFIENSNNHFTIHKRTGVIDGRATKFLLFSSLKVFGDGNRIGGIANRLERKGILLHRHQMQLLRKVKVEMIRSLVQDQVVGHPVEK